jgi:hypothetical protein
VIANPQVKAAMLVERTVWGDHKSVGALVKPQACRLSPRLQALYGQARRQEHPAGPACASGQVEQPEVRYPAGWIITGSKAGMSRGAVCLPLVNGNSSRMNDEGKLLHTERGQLQTAFVSYGWDCRILWLYSGHVT